MFRPATVRSLARGASRALAVSLASRGPLARRFISTTPPAAKSRSWKNLGVRVGLAGAVVYYYNTNTLFDKVVEDDKYVHHLPPATTDTEELPTLDSYPKTKKPSSDLTTPPATSIEPGEPQPPADTPAPGGAEELEAEASQQGAFNEETGEINWDCPCLGGMANGPCGPEFKEAFSCFVFSQEEPKGVDCIDKFKGMQDCFRRHPDIYGAELEDEEGEYPEGDEAPAVAKDREAESAISTSEKAAGEATSDESVAKNITAVEAMQAKHTETAESEDLVPKAWHDGTVDSSAPKEEKN